MRAGVGKSQVSFDHNQRKLSWDVLVAINSGLTDQIKKIASDLGYRIDDNPLFLPAFSGENGGGGSNDSTGKGRRPDNSTDGGDGDGDDDDCVLRVYLGSDCWSKVAVSYLDAALLLRTHKKQTQ